MKITKDNEVKTNNYSSSNSSTIIKYPFISNFEYSPKRYVLNLFGVPIDTNFNFLSNINDENYNGGSNIDNNINNSFNFKDLPFLFLIENDETIKINIKESALKENIENDKNNFFNFLFIEGFKFTYVVKFLNIENGSVYYNIVLSKRNLNDDEFKNIINSFLYSNIKSNKIKTILSYSKLDTFLFNNKILKI